jgi:peptide/nickel transport system permease protein
MALRAEITAESIEARPQGILHGASVWRRTLAAARQSSIFAMGLSLVGLFVFLAIFGRLLAPYSPITASPDALLGPTSKHWFGTDAAGLDVFSRVIAGAQVDITIALVATTVSLVVGSLFGLFASFIRHRVGEWLMRASDLMQAFPLFVLAIVYVTMAGRNPLNIITVVALLNAPIYVRLMRTQVLALRDRLFVEAARADGDSEISIALRHVLPNALTPAWAQASITMGWSIIVTAGLSFIGAGIRPPTPEWGSMIASGANGIVIGEWWMSVFPGLAMSLAVFGFASVGEGFQRILFSR